MSANTPWNPPQVEFGPALIDAQQQVGVTSVLDGFLSPMWAQAKQLHYKSLGRRSTGTQQWMSQITRCIWQIAWNLWVHGGSVSESTEAHTLPALHIALNGHHAINAAYQTYRSNPTPAPSLTRWFARPHAFSITNPLLENSLD